MVPRRLSAARFLIPLLSLAAVPARAATLGTVVPFAGGASDIVLDEPRNRLYLVNTTQSRVEIYSLAQPRSFRTPIRIDSTPLAAAMSRDGRLLFVTCYDSSSINVVNLDTQTVTSRVSLPAKPEGLAVGVDGRVLISTIGNAGGLNTLLIYDPSASANTAVGSVALTPPAPTPPVLPPPAQRPFLSVRSQLRATRDGRTIVGVNLPTGATRAVFVYDVLSGTVLRSRTVNGASSAIAIADDGSRFMAGPTLFETATLQVLAQHAIANSPYPLPAGVNFNAQATQGGSVFTPDGTTIYSGFNITPVQNPAARANISQLMIADPDNLLVRSGLQLAENLAGKMVITQDAQNIYALSESGVLLIPAGQANQSPLAEPDSTAVLLVNDQCGAFQQQRVRINVANSGRGRATVTAQLLANGAAGNGTVVPAATAPTAQVQNGATSSSIDFVYNTRAATALGTLNPVAEFLVQSPEAVNIPARVKVLQNNRDSESRADIVPIATGISTAEGLEDMVYDQSRQRLYIANSGLNRVEVFDIRTRRLLAPWKVGQMPRSLALSPDGATLYAASSNSESIAVIDPDRGLVTGRLRFPPIPINANATVVAPVAIASSQRGLLIAMSDGTLWSQIGNDLVPRGVSQVIGANAAGRPNVIPAPRSMASSPEGQFVILVGGPATAYLYDAQADDFVQVRQFATAAPAGYAGPVAAGPGGQYFVANGTLLNSALSAVATVPTLGTGLPVAVPVAALTQVGRTSYGRFTQNPAAAGGPTVEVVDVQTGVTLRSTPAVEGPATAAVNGRALPISGRTMAIDSSAATAYVLTVSGLSIVPLDPVLPADRPVVNPRGAVNMASYLPQVAPNGLISIFGRNMARDDKPSGSTLPTTLGGVCVTLSGRPIPLLLTGPQQINAQVPPDLAAGNYQMIVRNLERKAPSVQQAVAVSRYAPAVFVDGTGQASIFHAEDGKPVNKDNPTKRDQRLVIYGVGLGLPASGGRVVTGQPSPSNPAATTAKVQVYFGDPKVKEAEVAVESSILTPGLIGVYEIRVYVPGGVVRGDKLLVTLRIGGVDSPKTGPVLPYVTVE